MRSSETKIDINQNPMQFEDLAVSLAALASYARDEMDAPLRDMERLYNRSLQVPPDYREITSLTGFSLSGRDQHSGRAAWLLSYTMQLMVYGVHCQVWHRVAGKYYAPILSQLSSVLPVSSVLSKDKMQSLGEGPAIVDIVGVKDEAIWIVQVVTSTDVRDSALGRSVARSGNLFRGKVFGSVRLDSKSVSALRIASTQLRAAFPDSNVVPLVLVLHPNGPDFELFQVDLPIKDEPIELLEDCVVRNSIDFADQIAQDQSAIFRLPNLLDNNLFDGLPPCRGGRTLCTLASAVTRQLQSDNLLTWGLAELLEIMRHDFHFEVERDKLRHDVDERLTGQGFFRKFGPRYYVSVKGIARYQYCLAKFTTVGSQRFNLDLCIKHRDRIVAKYGCIN